MWENMEMGEVAFVIGMGVFLAAVPGFTVYATWKIFTSAAYREMVEEMNARSFPLLGALLLGALCIGFFVPVMRVVQDFYVYNTAGVEGEATVVRQVTAADGARYAEWRLPLPDGREQMLTREYSDKEKIKHTEGAQVPVLYLPDAPQRWIENERWARYLGPGLKVGLYLFVCCFAELMVMICLVLYLPPAAWRRGR